LLILRARECSGKELHLLDGLFGVFRPRTMTALMGSSGAGKTTLMDVLASRKTTGRVSGSVAVNGRPKEEAAFARMIGCVGGRVGFSRIRKGLNRRWFLDSE
jgi:ABC-type multidrug transport system ATPase subunit